VANGRVTVNGPLPRPTIAGTLAVDSAAARLEPLGITLTRMAARLRVAGDTVTIDSIIGRSGAGTVRVAGSLGIAEPARPFFNLQLRTDNARVINNEQGRLTADAQIAAFGPYDGVRVSGGVVVRNGSIYLPESDGKDVQVLSATDPALFAVADTAVLADQELLPQPDPLIDNLQLNLNLRVDRDVWVRSREANVEVYTDGDLTVGVNRRGPTSTVSLAGVVNTERGQYEFQGRRFEIVSGQATFLSGPTIDAALQAAAEYEVQQPGRQTLNIRLVIGGTVSNPRLALESNSQPPLTQSDLLGYLAFGSSTSSLLQQQGSSLAGGGGTGGAGGGVTGAARSVVQNQFAGIALGVMVDQFERSIARSLRADVLNVTAGDLPAAFGPGGALGFLQATEVEYGRYLSTQSYLAVVTRLSPDAFANAGVGLRYQYRTRLGLDLETTYQPRYLLEPPTLGEQVFRAIPVFGLFLTRETRF
jgi:translocation and assembly module TamB